MKKPPRSNLRAGLAEAIALAAQAHIKQVDKVGEPYILHPLRMMLRLSNEDERIAAVLHDVVEDTNVTLEDLRKRGFSKRVVSAVEALTKGEDETYQHFVKRARNNPIAHQVKLADLEDNLNVLRLPKITEKDVERLKKYLDARRFLLGQSTESGA